jgi:hypothetical protein
MFAGSSRQKVSAMQQALHGIEQAHRLEVPHVMIGTLGVVDMFVNYPENITATINSMRRNANLNEIVTTCVDLR